MALSGVFRCGIEHEVGLLDARGSFLDFENLDLTQLQRMLAQLPDDAGDTLYRDEIGVKRGRWYVEGYERYRDDGSYRTTTPKGIEVRTLPAASIGEAVRRLVADEAALARILDEARFTAVVTGFNPTRSTFFTPTPPLNAWEERWRRHTIESQTATKHMMTYGADVSISWADATPVEILDVTKKLTAYAPAMVAFSFSSPFATGGLWGGRSRRTDYRNGLRPAALAHGTADHMVTAVPSLTKVAMIPSEVGRIEFKAFDSVADLTLYGALLALVMGVALAPELEARADTPDSAALKRVARAGLGDDAAWVAASEVVTAAAAALPAAERTLLDPLRRMLETRVTPADQMIAAYNKGETIASILRRRL